MFTDCVWVCNQLTDDRLLERYTPTYSYEVAGGTAPLGWFKDLFPAGFQADAVLPFEFVYSFNIPSFDLNPAQRRLASTMIRDWTTFARTGKPGWTTLARSAA